MKRLLVVLLVGGLGGFLSATSEARSPGARVQSARPAKRLFRNVFGDLPITPIARWKLVHDPGNGKWYTVGSGGRRRTASGAYNFATINGETWVISRSKSEHIDVVGTMSAQPRPSAGNEHVPRGDETFVEFAGEVFFSGRTNRGRLKEFNNNSGHFQPTPEHADQSGFPIELFRAHVVEDKPLRAVRVKDGVGRN